MAVMPDDVEFDEAHVGGCLRSPMVPWLFLFGFYEKNISFVMAKFG